MAFPTATLVSISEWLGRTLARLWSLRLPVPQHATPRTFFSRWIS